MTLAARGRVERPAAPDEAVEVAQVRLGVEFRRIERSCRSPTGPTPSASGADQFLRFDSGVRRGLLRVEDVVALSEVLPDFVAELDSGVGPARADAHRFYFRHGLRIASHHFQRAEREVQRVQQPPSAGSCLRAAGGAGVTLASPLWTWPRPSETNGYPPDFPLRLKGALSSCSSSTSASRAGRCRANRNWD